MSRKLFWGTLAAAWVVVPLLVTRASADPQLGLFWGWETTGPASVRRLKDTSNGAVCYVATNPMNQSAAPAISCVKP